NQRGTAVGDKLVQVKHRLDPSVCMDCRVCPWRGGAAEECNELAPLHRADPNPGMDHGTIAGHGRHRSNGWPLMSALGQERKSPAYLAMSGLPARSWFSPPRPQPGGWHVMPQRP